MGSSRSFDFINSKQRCGLKFPITYQINLLMDGCDGMGWDGRERDRIR